MSNPKNSPIEKLEQAWQAIGANLTEAHRRTFLNLPLWLQTELAEQASSEATTSKPKALSGPTGKGTFVAAERHS